MAKPSKQRRPRGSSTSLSSRPRWPKQTLATPSLPSKKTTDACRWPLRPRDHAPFVGWIKKAYNVNVYTRFRHGTPLAKEAVFVWQFVARRAGLSLINSYASVHAHAHTSIAIFFPIWFNFVHSCAFNQEES